MSHPCNSRTPLPGENGMHCRDGSLLAKKREQWQKEKAEEKQWFPFGTRTSPRNRSWRSLSHNPETREVNTQNASASPEVGSNLPGTPTGVRSNLSIQQSVPNMATMASNLETVTRDQQFNTMQQVNPAYASGNGQSVPQANMFGAMANVAQSQAHSGPIPNNGFVPCSAPTPAATPAPIAMPFPINQMMFASQYQMPNGQFQSVPFQMMYPGMSATPGPGFVYDQLGNGNNRLAEVNNASYFTPIPHNLEDRPNSVKETTPDAHTQMPTSNFHAILAAQTQNPAHHPEYLQYPNPQLSVPQASFNYSPSPTTITTNNNSSFASMSLGNAAGFSSFDQQSAFGDQNQSREMSQDSGALSHLQHHSRPEDSLDEDKKARIKMRREEIDAQVEERRRLEAMYDAEERKELKQVVRDHFELEKRQLMENEEEQNKWKKRQEKLNENEKMFLMQKQRAEREAQLLKKARLHRHVLLSEDTDLSTVQRVLGVDDLETINSVMSQLGALERHKRIDFEKIGTSSASPHSPSGSRDGHRDSGMGTHSGTLSTASAPSRSERGSISSATRPPLPRKTPEGPIRQAGQNISGQNTPSPAQVSAKKVNQPASFQRNSIGRSSLRAPATAAGKIPSPHSGKSPVTNDGLRRRSGSAEKLTQTSKSPVRKSPVRPHTTRNETPESSPKTNSSAQTKVSTGTSPFKFTSPPVPPPRRQIPASKMSQNVATSQNFNSENFENRENFEKRTMEYVPSNPIMPWNTYPMQVPIPPPGARYLHAKEHRNGVGDHAARLLSDLPDNGEDPIKSRAINRERALMGHSAYSNSPATIGLFEPVPTRRNRQPRNMPQNADFDPKLDANHNKRHHNSAGASSVATSTESHGSGSTSPVSISPPLSAGYKSASPFSHSNNQSSGVGSHEGSTSPDTFNNNNNNDRKSSEVERIMARGMTAMDNGQSTVNDPRERFKSPSRLKVLLTTPSGSRDDLMNGNHGDLDSRKFGMKPPMASPFTRKLAGDAQGAVKKLSAGDYLAPEALRRNLRSPTMMRLQESLGNLSVASTTDIETGNSQSRPMTPSKPFNCRTTNNYRSLNLKRDTQRQHRILEQLAQVRCPAEGPAGEN
ncbi:hypothetical protein DdX_15849 [Ditylenchus destructor]|uniref:Uncharacterized protein n=1 Tax=Ditylenchus destructor TaxID=166010 RepID=A0AAD4MQ27_9BILA|nr:hypothetical protein DdX_15849 [Ditylenchus destructor]